MTELHFPKICVVLSAGGSAFESAFRISGIDAASFHIVTDRECGAEDRAASLGIQHDRIAEPDRDRFSAKVSKIAKTQNCDIVLLHFSRLVTSELFETLLTFNVHPSLLPAFPGLDGVASAFEANSLVQGATLHLVDSGVDTGPIVSQTSVSVPLFATLEWRYKLSYAQKVIVSLSLFDLASAGKISSEMRGVKAVNRDGLAPGALVNPRFLKPEFQKAADSILQAALSFRPSSIQ